MRLATATVDRLPAAIARPGYARQEQARGIVHLGLGAFTRAHQLAYSDAAMAAGDSGWMTEGVSLRSSTVNEQLAPQDGLYTIAIGSAAGTEYQLVGALRNVLVAPQEPDKVIAAIADPAVKIVTLTITEKGYYRGPDGKLDRNAAALASDLAGADQAQTIYGFIASGLAQRMAAGAPGLTLLSCDNMPANGALLRRLLLEFLGERDAALADWFATNCTCPSSMVDRIVPATTEADRDHAEAALGLRDEGLVMAEPFSQWVIEDDFANGRPGWDRVGAELTTDILPYEQAKLRMLNGAHSALAYLGLLRGHEFVHQAIGDGDIRPLIERLMRVEAAPTITTAAGQDLGHYADQLLARFENPALEHRLIQIAMDGSQKIPQRWLETLAANKGAQQCDAILAGIAGWLRHVRGDLRPVDDPMAETLAAIWRSAGIDGIVAATFGPGGPLASDWQPSEAERSVITKFLSRY